MAYNNLELLTEEDAERISNLYSELSAAFEQYNKVVYEAANQVEYFLKQAEFATNHKPFVLNTKKPVNVVRTNYNYYIPVTRKNQPYMRRRF